MLAPAAVAFGLLLLAVEDRWPPLLDADAGVATVRRRTRNAHGARRRLLAHGARVRYLSDVLAAYALGAAWLVAMTVSFSALRQEEGHPPVDPMEGAEPELA